MNEKSSSLLEPMDRLDEKTPTANTLNNKTDYFDHTANNKGESSPEDEEIQKKTEDELRRRGSVDDRAMTMGGVRLFVANPDLDD